MKIPILSRLFEKRESWTDEKWWRSIGWIQPSKSGITVSGETAMRATAVWSAIRVLSWTLASLPLIVYRTLPRGKEKATDNSLYNILHSFPNSYQSSFTFRSTAMTHLCLWGNAYAEIEFNSQGQAIALWPIPPWRITPYLNSQRELRYKINLSSNQLDIKGAQQDDLPYYKIIHILGLGTNGFIGLSPIQLAKESIGLSLAAEEFGARYFGDGTNTGGVVTHPLSLSDKAYERLKVSMEQAYEGLSKAHRIMFLEEGMKFDKTTIPPDQSQFLETRKFQVREIARIFNVPPHMIGDLEQATFSNIEHQAIEFVVHTMRPWFVNWEQELNRKLFLNGDNEKYFVEFLVDGLLRGDTVARYQAYSQARQWGWLSANDIRELENQNPLPGEEGDIYLVPLNMQPTSWLGTAPSAAPVAAASLNLITRSFRHVFEEAGRRIIERDAQNVRRAVKKHLSERTLNDFTAWLEDNYRDFTKFITSQILPPAIALNEAIRISMDGTLIDTDSSVIQYINAFSIRYAESSKEQIIAILKQVDDGIIIDLQQAAELINQRLDEWLIGRVAEIAEIESAQLANFIEGELMGRND